MLGPVPWFLCPAHEPLFVEHRRTRSWGCRRTGAWRLFGNKLNFMNLSFSFFSGDERAARDRRWAVSRGCVCAVWCWCDARGACLLTAAFYFVRFSSTLRLRGSFFSVSFSRRRKQRVSHSQNRYKFPQRVDSSAPKATTHRSSGLTSGKVVVDVGQKQLPSPCCLCTRVLYCCFAVQQVGGRTSRFVRTSI